MGTLIELMVIAVIAVGIYLIIAAIPMEALFKRILMIILSVFLFLMILQTLGIYDSGVRFNLR